MSCREVLVLVLHDTGLCELPLRAEKGKVIMKEFSYVITDADGIHARPAGELVKEAKQFSCSIKMTKDGKSGDCKKIFGIMGLAVKQGNEVTVTFDGDDEDAAYEAVSKFMQDNM